MTSPSRAYWWTTLALSGVAGLLAILIFGPTRRLAVQDRDPADTDVVRLTYLQNLQPDPHRRTFPMPAHNQFILALWEPLIECDPVTGEPRPAAAEHWAWSADRLTLTLTLREKGRWSNGDPVTAHDFVRGWQRLLRGEPSAAATLFILRNAEAFHRGELASPAAVGVEALDDRTLKLSLTAERSTLVTELAEPLLSPLHASTEAALRNEHYAREPETLVTNGAFALAAANTKGFRLRVNPHYWDRAHVALAGAEFIRVDGPRLGQLAVASGQADISGTVLGPGSASLPTDRAVTEEAELALSVIMMDLNVTRGPLQDLRVRRALALAVDRRGPIELTDRENLVPAYSWVPDMPGRPGLKVMRENIEEARALLAEAGYPGGRGFPVLRMPIASNWRRVSYAHHWTERWFRELGIRTYLAYVDEASLSDFMRAGDYDIYYSNLIATVPDAGDMLSTFAMPGFYSGSRWENPQIGRLLAEADRKTGAERLALLETLERTAMEAVPTIPMMFDRRRTLVANEVTGWYADPLGRQSIKRLALRKTAREIPALLAR